MKRPNFETLRQLRNVFLYEPTHEDYWAWPEALPSYDATFGERIAWKWQAVLADLQSRGWTPSTSNTLDWACGTGRAARVFATHFSESQIYLSDRSGLALDFASQAIPGSQRGLPDGEFTLLLSHVLSELDPTSLNEIFKLLYRASSVIWVEGGTSKLSHQLISIREECVGKDNDAHPFYCWAPCGHQAPCPLPQEENQRHWCHQFVRTPSEAHQSAHWAEFSRRLSVDLRSLPLSYLVLDRRRPSQDYDRIIGKSRFSKGVCRRLFCRPSGLEEIAFLKREHPELFKKKRELDFLGEVC